ncbi:uncharacterized protein LOC122509565 [Leptopilina heterotoma]|uniref:uncharacterized protein LOC122509565 n=1 Tax=Leptopilina heterotoma TaxID=63436 RepID=UPI001CA9733B|nr:uncharacterized protein LOC122509565 [Leptopilina heterotoma]
MENLNFNHYQPEVMPVNGRLKLVYPHIIFGPFPDIFYVGNPDMPILNYWGQYHLLRGSVNPNQPRADSEPEEPEDQEEARPEVPPPLPRPRKRGCRAGRQVREKREAAIAWDRLVKEEKLIRRWRTSHESIPWHELQAE